LERGKGEEEKVPDLSRFFSGRADEEIEIANPKIIFTFEATIATANIFIHN